MEQHEVNDLYQLALDVQLQDHKVGRVLAAFVRHLAATEGLTPDQLKEAPPEERTPATDVEMDTAPLGEDHSQVPTPEVPFPSRERPVGLAGEPLSDEELERFNAQTPSDEQERAQADEEQTEKRESHRGGRGRKKALEPGDEVKLDEPDQPQQEERPSDVGLHGFQEGE